MCFVYFVSSENHITIFAILFLEYAVCTDLALILV